MGITQGASSLSTVTVWNMAKLLPPSGLVRTRCRATDHQRQGSGGHPLGPVSGVAVVPFPRSTTSLSPKPRCLGSGAEHRAAAEGLRVPPASSRPARGLRAGPSPSRGPASASSPCRGCLQEAAEPRRAQPSRAEPRRAATPGSRRAPAPGTGHRARAARRRAPGAPGTGPGAGAGAARSALSAAPPRPPSAEPPALPAPRASGNTRGCSGRAGGSAAP